MASGNSFANLIKVDNTGSHLSKDTLQGLLKIFFKCQLMLENQPSSCFVALDNFPSFILCKANGCLFLFFVPVTTN